MVTDAEPRRDSIHQFKNTSVNKPWGTCQYTEIKKILHLTSSVEMKKILHCSFKTCSTSWESYILKTVEVPTVACTGAS